MSKLDLDKKTVRTAGKNLGEAVEDYSDFGKKPFTDEIEMLNGMNTDFTAHFRTILMNINDSNAGMLKNLEEAAKKAIEIVDKFEEVDENAVGKMKKSKK